MSGAFDCSSHLYHLMASSRRAETVDKAFTLAQEAMNRGDMKSFDTVVFSGFSGAFIGMLTAQRFNADMLMIRKEEDRNNHGQQYEGRCDPERVLIVDDLISSGATMNRIVQGMRKHIVVHHQKPAPDVVGILLYDGATLHTPKGTAEFAWDTRAYNIGPSFNRQRWRDDGQFNWEYFF